MRYSIIYIIFAVAVGLLVFSYFDSKKRPDFSNKAVVQSIERAKTADIQLPPQDEYCLTEECKG